MLRSLNLAGWYFHKNLFSDAESRAKFWTKRRNTLQRPKKDQSSANDVRALNSRIASVVCDAVSNRWGRMTGPMCSFVSMKNLCFLSSSVALRC